MIKFRVESAGRVEERETACTIFGVTPLRATIRLHGSKDHPGYLDIILPADLCSHIVKLCESVRAVEVLFQSGITGVPGSDPLDKDA